VLDANVDDGDAGAMLPTAVLDSPHAIRTRHDPHIATALAPNTATKSEAYVPVRSASEAPSQEPGQGPARTKGTKRQP